MPKKVVLVALMVVAFAAMLGPTPQRSDAAFHLMRVYGVMGGANGLSEIQYVELRMTDAGQNFLGPPNSMDICFFDASGTPYARFTFPSNPANGADEASILIGTTEFDMAWTAGTPDFIFSPSNTVALQAGADVNHPIRSPAGKVSFGGDSATVPASMCIEPPAGGAAFGAVDSVMYGGAGYTGTPSSNDHLPVNASSLPTAGSEALRLQGPICIPTSFSSPCPPPNELHNDVDYALEDVNAAGEEPRNNGGAAGPISPDMDGDGDDDVADNCPAWANADQLPPAWAVPAGDLDCDGWPGSVQAGSKASELFIGTAPAAHCAANSGANNEPLPDAWPADFDDNQIVDGADVLKFGVPFLSTAPGPPYAVRFDFNADSFINGADVLQFGAYFLKRCEPLP